MNTVQLPKISTKLKVGSALLCIGAIAWLCNYISLNHSYVYVANPALVWVVTGLGCALFAVEAWGVAREWTDQHSGSKWERYGFVALKWAFKAVLATMSFVLSVMMVGSGHSPSSVRSGGYTKENSDQHREEDHWSYFDNNSPDSLVLRDEEHYDLNP